MPPLVAETELDTGNHKHNERPTETPLKSTTSPTTTTNSNNQQLHVSDTNNGKDENLPNDNDGTKVPKEQVEKAKPKETLEKEQQQQQQQEMIRKAIAFWNHPGLQDVSSKEKRAYLHEQQGLTNAQIHEVWEELVAYSTSGSSSGSNSSSANIASNNNYPGTSTRNGSHHARQSLSRSKSNPHHQQHRNNPQSSFRGPAFRSNEAPNTNYDDYYNTNTNHHHYGIGTGQQPQPLHQPLHQPLQQHQQPLPYNTEQESDGSISVARGTTLLAVGGFLGVTGAAALRWLNGGRFELIPPPSAAANTANGVTAKTGNGQSRSLSSSSGTQQQQQQQNKMKEIARDEQRSQWDTQKQQRNSDSACDYNAEEYQDDEYNDDDDDDCLNVEEYVLERMDALLSVVQERLLSKLNTSSITDQSMSLLKQNNNAQTNTTSNNEHNTKNSNSNNNNTEPSKSNPMFLVQLKEMKDDLVRLCDTIAKQTKNNKIVSDSNSNNEQKSNKTHDFDFDLRNESSTLLAKFESCIQRLEEETNSVNGDAATKPGGFPSGPVSVSAETNSNSNSTGAIQQQDTLPIPAAPSTPPSDGKGGNRIDATSTTTTNANTAPLSLRDCILQITKKNDPLTLKTGSQLLYLYLANLSGKPDNRRYRKMFVSNESFRKVDNLVGGKDLLKAVGFVEDPTNGSNGGVLEWVPTGSTEQEIAALVLVKEAAAALGVLKNANLNACANGIPSSELIASALSKLSSSSSSSSNINIPHPSSPQQELLDKNQHRHHEDDDDDDDVLQTPSGSSLLSPPMPKKLPFFPTPSGEDRS